MDQFASTATTTATQSTSASTDGQATATATADQTVAVDTTASATDSVDQATDTASSTATDKSAIGDDATTSSTDAAATVSDDTAATSTTDDAATTDGDAAATADDSPASDASAGSTTDASAGTSTDAKAATDTTASAKAATSTAMTASAVVTDTAAAASTTTEDALVDPGIKQGYEYVVRSADNNSQLLDIMGDSTAQGGNLALYQGSYQWWQKFRFYNVGNQGWRIVASHSNLSLTYDADGNVTQRTWTGSPAQLWLFESAGNGYWRIASAKDGKYLDVEGGHAGNSVNVRMWVSTTNNDGKGQMWRLQYVPYRTVADGTYSVFTNVGGYQVLNITDSSTADGGNLAIYKCTNTANQKFEVTYNDNGYYTLRNVNSGKVVDVEGSGKTSGTNVSQFTNFNNTNQRWEIVSLGGGYYRLNSQCNGLSLTVAGGSSADGTNVDVETKVGGSKAQQFKFVRMLDDGYYTVGSLDDTSKVLDVVASSTANGANVTLWQKTKHTNQIWQVQHAYGPYYRLIDVHSWKALSVVSGESGNGANVVQATQSASTRQIWRADVDSAGHVVFVNQATGLRLDVEGGHAGSGVNVKTWESTTNNNARGQKWVLSSVNYKISDDNELNSMIADLVADHPTLEDAFYYVASYPYVRENEMPTGEWSIPYAKEMYQNHGGNCYRYAALFRWMAEGLGYDAGVVSGYVKNTAGENCPHGWTEIYLNSRTYVCDSDMYHAYQKYQWYMTTYETSPIVYYFW